MMVYPMNRAGDYLDATGHDQSRRIVPLEWVRATDRGNVRIIGVGGICLAMFVTPPEIPCLLSDMIRTTAFSADGVSDPTPTSIAMPLNRFVNFPAYILPVITAAGWVRMALIAAAYRSSRESPNWRQWRYSGCEWLPTVANRPQPKLHGRQNMRRTG